MHWRRGTRTGILMTLRNKRKRIWRWGKGLGLRWIREGGSVYNLKGWFSRDEFKAMEKCKIGHYNVLTGDVKPLV